MGITSFNAFCSESTSLPPDERIAELKKIFPIIITVVGSIGVGGNILNLFTLRSSSLQTVPFRYIRALALFDLIGLTAILLHCIFAFTGAMKFLPIAYYSVYVEDFLINSFLVAGLYCAVLLTVERYLLLRNPHSKRIYINSVFAKILGVLIFSILLHCPMILQVTHKENPDGSWKKGNNKEVLCKEPYWTIYSYYGFFREFLRFACVFVLVALNIFIARQLQIAKKNRRLLKKHSSTLDASDQVGLKGEKNSLMKSFTEKRLTALMVAICFIYVVGNVPQTIVMMFQNESTEAKFSFQVFRYIANTFETLNHCLNFFVFCMASSEYTRAFLNSCPCIRNRLESIPCCSRFLHSRRFTVSEYQSESRIAILRKSSTVLKDSIFEKNSNRRNTAMSSFLRDSTVLRRDSTMSSTPKTSPVEKLFNRRNTTMTFLEDSTIISNKKNIPVEKMLNRRNKTIFLERTPTVSTIQNDFIVAQVLDRKNKDILLGRDSTVISNKNNFPVEKFLNQKEKNLSFEKNYTIAMRKKDYPTETLLDGRRKSTSSGKSSTTTIDPQYVFSPENARWRYERDILTQNWPLDEHHFWPGKSYDFPGYVDVIAAAKKDEELGRPNMLISKYINELDRINKYIIHNLSVPIEHDGKNYDVTYTDLCMTYDWKCYLNDHITILRPKSHWGTFEGQLAEFASEIIEKEIKITYPIGWRGTEPIYFGSLISGVHLTDDEGHFDYVKAVRLTYNTREQIVGNISYIWRKKVAAYLSSKENPPSQILEFGLYHNESLPEGLQDVADTLTPKFIIMSSLIFAFCVGTALVFLRKDNVIIGIDWVRSKPILGLAALVCPLLATGSAFGLVLWTGEYYNAIVNIAPFIIICIGIDDAFLMGAAWHRTNPELSVARRVAETLSEAAVAISITSITDMLTFGIGCMTSLPGVRLFCLYTFWGITFTYIYQITYFTAVLAYSGEMEDKGIHSLFGIKCIHLELANTKLKRLFFAGSICRDYDRKRDESSKIEAEKLPEKKPVSDEQKTRFISKVRSFLSSLSTKEEDSDQSLDSHHGRETFVNWFFREWYGPQLLLTVSKSMVLVIYLIYIFAAIYGCAQIKEGLNPKHLVRSSFYLTDFYVLIDETFWQEGLQMQVVVNNPPDLFNPKTRSRFDDMVKEFENSDYTMMHNATMMWIYAFEDKLEEDEMEKNISKPISSSDYYHRAREWLLTAGGRRLWELDMVWGKNESDPEDWDQLRTFRFQVGLRNYRTPTDHTNSCKLMREIAERYPEMNITTFHEYYPFADQYLQLKPALFQNCILAVISMFIVAVIMIPHIGAAFAIIIAIISIDIGVLGFMALWGVNLESVSMITVIMSIGFSVDLSAHISYAYVKSPGNSSQKAIAALETLGWPVFLGAFTTIIGIMILTFVDAYIVQIFFKTIFLVIGFSLCHGLLFLPILLTIMLPNAKIPQKKSTSKEFASRKMTPKILQRELRDSIDSESLQEINLETCNNVKN